MSKMEIRRQLLETSNAGGNEQMELAELKKLHKTETDGIETITLTCSSLFSLICCE